MNLYRSPPNRIARRGQRMFTRDHEHRFVTDTDNSALPTPDPAKPYGRTPDLPHDVDDPDRDQSRFGSPGLPPGNASPLAPGSVAESFESFIPSNTNPQGTGAGQPSLPQPRHIREVVARYPWHDAQGNRYVYTTASANNGTGDYLTERSTPATVNPPQLVAVHDGSSHFYVGDSSYLDAYTVYRQPRIPSDLCKTANWAQDARRQHATMRAAQTAQEYRQRDTLASMNAAAQARWKFK